MRVQSMIATSTTKPHENISSKGMPSHHSSRCSTSSWYSFKQRHLTALMPSRPHVRTTVLAAELELRIRLAIMLARHRCSTEFQAVCCLESAVGRSREARQPHPMLLDSILTGPFESTDDEFATEVTNSSCELLLPLEKSGQYSVKASAAGSMELMRGSAKDAARALQQSTFEDRSVPNVRMTDNRLTSAVRTALVESYDYPLGAPNAAKPIIGRYLEMPFVWFRLDELRS